MTVILLAVIFGVSATLFFGKALLQKGETTVSVNVPATMTTSVSPSVPETPASVDVPQVEVPSPEGSPIATPAEPSVVTAPASAAPASVSPAAESTVTQVPATQTTRTQTTGTQVTGKKKPAPTAPTAAATTVTKPTDRNTSVKPSVTKKPSIVPTSVSVVTRPPDKTLVPKHKGTLIFVFDDAGNNLKQLEPFLKLPFPCTIAVLPGLRYSKETADRIRAAGKDVILHQPMQALNLSVKPGPGAIVKGMNGEQIKTLLRKNLAEVGPVVGMNNHEGSLITADRTSMEAVLDVVREQRIFFLDSRTNADTVAPILAREKNMTIWERAVFLDNSQDQASIIEAVQSGMKIAENKGAAVMIGHIWSNDLADILIGMYPELVSQGFSLSTIAEIAMNGEFDE